MPGLRQLVASSFLRILVSNEPHILWTSCIVHQIHTELHILIIIHTL
jgi:hypothetical protein